MGSSIDISDLPVPTKGPDISDLPTPPPVENTDGFFTNVLHSAENKVGDWVRGFKQAAAEGQSQGQGEDDPESIAAGAPPMDNATRANIEAEGAAKADALYREQQAANNDPTRQALDNTWGGKVGKYGTEALPYIGTALLAPEGLPALAAAGGVTGAAEGALTPLTSADQSRTKNALQGGVVGAIGNVAPSVVFKGAGAALAALAGKDPELASQMVSTGMTPTLGAVSKTVKGLAGKTSGSQDALVQNGKEQVVQAALKKVGGADFVGDNLEPSTLNALEEKIWKPANAITNGIKVPATTPLIDTAQKVADMGLDASADAKDALNDFTTSGQMDGKKALDLFRYVRNQAQTTESPVKAKALQDFADQLSGQITAASPDGGAALAEANRLHPSLMVLRNVATRAKSGDLPTIDNWKTSNGLSKFTDKNGVGPFSDLLAVANNAFASPAGTSGRYSTLAAKALSESLPMLGSIVGSEGEHSVTGFAAGKALGWMADKGAAKALTSLAMKPVNTLSAKDALMNAILAGKNAKLPIVRSALEAKKADDLSSGGQ